MAKLRERALTCATLHRFLAFLMFLSCLIALSEPSDALRAKHRRGIVTVSIPGWTRWEKKDDKYVVGHAPPRAHAHTVFQTPFQTQLPSSLIAPRREI